MARLLGIDVGTSGAKAVVVNEAGNVLQSAVAEYPLSIPRPGWAEQDPEDWWAGVQTCLERLDGPFDAVGVTGQMHGSVFLDRDVQVVRPALLWCDQRTTEECAQIESAVGPERLRSVTCNPMLTGFQLPKVLWLRNAEPEAFARVEHVLLPKDFIVHRLTGVLSSDASDASGTGILDVSARTWSREVADAVGVPLGWLPPVHESWAVVGTTADGTPVVAGAGDQAAGAVGVGSVTVGDVSVSLGTSGVAFAPVGVPVADPAGSLHVFCHANGGYHAMGVMLSCGGAVRWARDAFFPGSSFQDLDRAAANSPPGSDGVTFWPYLAGERCPFVDPRARGQLSGLSLSSGTDQIARAVLEGVTCGIIDCLDAVTSNVPAVKRVRVTGGGASSPFWLQLLSDMSGLELATVSTDEGPSFGAALLSGVGVGLWPDVITAAKLTAKEKNVIVPGPDRFQNVLERYRAHRPYGLLKT